MLSPLIPFLTLLHPIWVLTGIVKSQSRSCKQTITVYVYLWIPIRSTEICHYSSGLLKIKNPNAIKSTIYSTEDKQANQTHDGVQAALLCIVSE